MRLVDADEALRTQLLGQPFERVPNARRYLLSTWAGVESV